MPPIGTTILAMRGVVLLLAAFLALIVVTAPPASRHDGRITAIVGESGDIGPTPRFVVMDADGQNAGMLLGWVYDAAFSPDGHFLAFDQVGAAQVHRTYEQQIWLERIKAPRAARRLVRNAMNPDWSSDANAIAFDRLRKGGDDVWVKDMLTGGERRVVRNADAPDWTRDGTQLAFVRGKDIWVVGRAGGTSRRLIRNGTEPKWSPGGDRIAFVRENEIESAVYIARADGSAVRRVSPGDSVAWSPDGTELAIAEFRSIVRVRSDGTALRVIHRECCAWRNIDWVR